MQIARKTDDRYRDLSPKQRDAAAAYLRKENAPSHFMALVQSGGSLDREEQGLVFGESLPKGLRLGIRTQPHAPANSNPVACAHALRRGPGDRAGQRGQRLFRRHAAAAVAGRKPATRRLHAHGRAASRSPKPYCGR